MKYYLIEPNHLPYFQKLDPFGLLPWAELPGAFAVGCVVKKDGVDHPVGLMICSSYARHVVVEWLFVIEKARGRGIGGELLALAFQEAMLREDPFLFARLKEEFEDTSLMWHPGSYFREHCFDQVIPLPGSREFSMAEMAKALGAEQNRPVRGITAFRETKKEEILQFLQMNDFKSEAALIRLAEPSLSCVLRRNGTIQGVLMLRKGKHCYVLDAFYAYSPDERSALVSYMLYHSGVPLKKSDEVRFSCTDEVTAAWMKQAFSHTSFFGERFIVADTARFKEEYYGKRIGNQKTG